MDYYRKLMGNGTVTSKFRLTGQFPMVQLQESNVRNNTEDSVVAVKDIEKVESPDTHHPNNCNRCYRLKKKCSREKPSCGNCVKTRNECEYVLRSNKRRRRNAGANSTPSAESTGNGSTGSGEPIAGNADLTSNRDLSGNADFIDASNGFTEGASSSVTANDSRVLVSSLLTDEPKFQQDFKLRETGKVNKRDKQLSDKVMNSLMKSTDMKDEYITMKLSGDLSIVFMDNYFDNFELQYPFISRSDIEKQIDAIDFEVENIINLDIFLILAIGCLIYDYNHKSNQFAMFKEKLTSIIDMLSYSQLNMKILVLLVIYSLETLNEQLAWNLMGILTRLVVKCDLYKGPSPDGHDLNKDRSSDDDHDDRVMFWTIYNLDKELSLMLKKPSQLPQDEFITTSPVDSGENTEIVNQFITLYKYYNQILTLNLLPTFDNDRLHQLSTNIETWRSTTNKLVSKYFIKSNKLGDYINFINLHYYYLLIEIDQLSPLESWQFTLQFLSNSFSLILQEDVSNKLSINNLYWYKKLFNVIKYQLKSILKLVNGSLNKVDLSLKLTEFNSCLQLIINLLNYLNNNNTQDNDINQTIDNSLLVLTKLNGVLGKYNAIVSKDHEKAMLIHEIKLIHDNYRI